MDEWCNLIDLMGFKLVDKDMLCVPRDVHEFMRRTTARAMANEQASAMLFEDVE